MGKLPVRLLAILIAAGVGVVGSSDATAAPPVNCGPGPHWVDTCAGLPAPPHADVYATSPVVKLDLNLDPNCDTDSTTPVTGSVTVHRQDASDNSTNFPLLPNPPTTDLHIDAIDTEIVSMVLTGGGFILRAGAGGAPALLPSKGLVVEKAGDNTKADSFFDVFFELDLGGGAGPKVYNQQPLRVTSVIGQVPPTGAVFMQPGVCLPLYTFTAGGIHVANLAVPPPVIGGIAEPPDVTALPSATAASGRNYTGYALGAAVAFVAAVAAAAGWRKRRT